MEIEDLLKLARRWTDEDPDALTKQEALDLIAKSDTDTIRDQFGSRVEFGTAGLRAVLGAGPNRMNRAVVRFTTSGLARYLIQTVPKAQLRGVVVGYDARRMSREFAEDTARVLVGHGFRVTLFDDVVPTPLVAFACKSHGAAAGIAVTASHNPPAYNGYKVYWENGAQIIPPVDGGIAKAIAGITSLADVPLAELPPVTARAAIEAEYLEIVRRLDPPETQLSPPIVAAYTALHGVGASLFKRVAEMPQVSRIVPVPEQDAPDGAFPTVAFPNPEEPGALDLLLRTARDNNVDVALANDPDADRLAMAYRAADKEFRVLTGNELGQLLADYVLERRIGVPPGSSEARFVVSSIVSSPMIDPIAKKHGAKWYPALTGFKWIANTAIDRAKAGERFVFGYEEALGYTIADVVRDKDGISAGHIALRMAAWHRAQGRTLGDAWIALARAVGYYVSKQIAVTAPGALGRDRIRTIMRTFRETPISSFGRFSVEQTHDLERRDADGRPDNAWSLPTTDLVVFMLTGGHRIMLRPSGTEPKIKYYFDVREEMIVSEPATAARARAEAKLAEIVDAFLDSEAMRLAQASQSENL